MTHGAIDMASKWREEKTCGVKSLRLTLSPHCWMIVGRPLSNKIHPENTVDAQFSAYYQLAVAWLDGNKTGWGVYDRIHDKDVRNLAEHITVDAADDLRGLAGNRVGRGTTDSDYEKEPLGETSNPFTWTQLQQKFRALLIPAYGEAKTGRIISATGELDKCQNSREFMSLCA